MTNEIIQSVSTLLHGSTLHISDVDDKGYKHLGISEYSDLETSASLGFVKSDRDTHIMIIPHNMGVPFYVLDDLQRRKLAAWLLEGLP